MLKRPARPTAQTEILAGGRRRRRPGTDLDKGLTGTGRRGPACTRPSCAVARRRDPGRPKLTGSPARSPTANIGDTLVARGVRLSLGGPSRPRRPDVQDVLQHAGRGRRVEARGLDATRQGTAIARARGSSRQEARATARQQAEPVRMTRRRRYTIAGLMEVLSVGPRHRRPGPNRTATSTPGHAAVPGKPSRGHARLTGTRAPPSRETAGPGEHTTFGPGGPGFDSGARHRRHAGGRCPRGDRGSRTERSAGETRSRQEG